MNPTTHHEAMTDTIQISTESRAKLADEQYQGALGIGRTAYIRHQLEETREHETQPMAMHAAPVCPPWLWWLFTALIIALCPLALLAGRGVVLAWQWVLGVAGAGGVL